MSKTSAIPTVQTVNNVDGSILPAGTTTKQLVWTAGANDGVVKSFCLTSTDTADHVVQIFFNKGGSGTDRLIGTVKVPLGSGTDGVIPAVDVLRSGFIAQLSFDAFGNKVLYATAGSKIYIASTVTVTAAKSIDAFGEGGDF